MTTTGFTVRDGIIKKRSAQPNDGYPWKPGCYTKTFIGSAQNVGLRFENFLKCLNKRPGFTIIQRTDNIHTNQLVTTVTYRIG